MHLSWSCCCWYVVVTHQPLETYLLHAAEVHFGLGKHDDDLSDVVVKEQLKVTLPNTTQSLNLY